MSMYCARICFLSLFVLASGSVASAAVVANIQSSSGKTDFDSYIDTDDLINSGQSTFVNSTNSVAPFSGYPLTGLNDGSGSSSGRWPENSLVTFTLDTITNPYGYDITEINTILGYSSHADFYAHHNYDITYSQVDAPSVFLDLYTADEDPFTSGGSGSSMLTLTPDAGVLASGVAKIQFNIFKTSSATTGLFHEIDIQGQATLPAPEPSSLLLALGGLVAIRVGARRRRARAA